jgi:hypothetical protein
MGNDQIPQIDYWSCIRGCGFKMEALQACDVKHYQVGI